MSRSGYHEYEPHSQEEQWAHIRWRGAVKSAIRGRRGQKLLRELRDGMDAMPEKKLISDTLEKDGCFCALGVVGKHRGMSMAKIDAQDSEQVAGAFDIAEALAREIVYTNDEHFDIETDEARWIRVRQWVQANIRDMP